MTSSTNVFETISCVEIMVAVAWYLGLKLW